MLSRNIYSMTSLKKNYIFQLCLDIKLLYLHKNKLSPIYQTIIFLKKCCIAIPSSIPNREKNYLYTEVTIAKINFIQFITSAYVPNDTYITFKIWRISLSNQKFLLSHSPMLITVAQKSKNVSPS